MLLPLLAAATILMLLLLVLMLLPASEMEEEGNFDAEYISTAQCVHWKRKLAKTTTGWVWISCLSILSLFLPRFEFTSQSLRERSGLWNK